MVALITVAALASTLTQNAELTPLIERYMAEHKVAGLTVAVMQDGKFVYNQAYGFQDLENKVSTTRKTRFRLASVSKPVTAVCVMQLVEQKKLNLDENIRKYVSEWPEATHPITLRQILAHRSGIRHYQPGKPGTEYVEKSTSDALKMFKDDPLLFEPGSKYSYSTHAYTVAVAAIENLSGITFRDFLNRNIARQVNAPTLQCENMVSVWPKDRSKHYQVVKDVAVLDVPTENISWKYGGGGLESTAEDLSKFGWAVLTDQLTSKESRETMWRDPEGDGYGLGWDLSGDRVQHTGSQQGARSALLINPKKKLVLVVMTNTGGNPIGTIADSIMDHFEAK